MTLFKDEYNDLYQKVSPSPALEAETLELMAELQAHAAPAIPPAPKKKWVLPTVLSAAAAMLAIAVGIGYWFLKPPAVMEDPKGEFGAVISDVELNFGAPEAGNSSGSAPQEGLPQEQENSAPPADSGAAQKNPSDDTDASNGSSGGATKPSTESGEETVDPRLPVVIDESKTQTYLSLAEFARALARKETPGFGESYRASVELITVPTFLPQTARFRHLHFHSNGSYEYSYLITAGGVEYLLDIQMEATMPKTLRDLQLRKNNILAGEVIDYDANPSERIYYVGRYDTAHVTLSTLDGKKLNKEQIDKILLPFDLGRYTTGNPFLDLTYKN